MSNQVPISDPVVSMDEMSSPHRFPAWTLGDSGVVGTPEDLGPSLRFKESWGRSQFVRFGRVPKRSGRKGSRKER